MLDLSMGAIYIKPSKQVTTHKERQMTLEDIFAGLDSDPTLATRVTKPKKNKEVVKGQLTDPVEAAIFMTAGHSTFTLRSRTTGNRFTYRVQLPRDKETGKLDRTSSIHFVSLLNGADNENSYIYIGYIKRGVYYHGDKSKVGKDATSNVAFTWVWRQLTQNRIPASLEIWHEGRCGRCGRKLTVPSSVKSGIGPECQNHMGM
jgi:hypothetical protein